MTEGWPPGGGHLERMTEEDFDQWLTQHRTDQTPVRPVPDAVRLPNVLTRALAQLKTEYSPFTSPPPLPVPVPPPLLS